MKKKLTKAKCTAKLRKSEYYNEWYLIIESYPVFKAGSKNGYFGENDQPIGDIRKALMNYVVKNEKAERHIFIFIKPCVRKTLKVL